MTPKTPEELIAELKFFKDEHIDEAWLRTALSSVVLEAADDARSRIVAESYQEKRVEHDYYIYLQAFAKEIEEGNKQP